MLMVLKKLVMDDLNRNIIIFNKLIFEEKRDGRYVYYSFGS